MQPNAEQDDGNIQAAAEEINTNTTETNLSIKKKVAASFYELFTDQIKKNIYNLKFLLHHYNGFKSQACIRFDRVWIESSPSKLLLTAQFDPDEVLDSQVFQEHARGGRGLKQEGDVGAQLSVEGGEVEVRRLLVEKRRVPEVLWETQWKLTVKIFTWKSRSRQTRQHV